MWRWAKETFRWLAVLFLAMWIVVSWFGPVPSDPVTTVPFPWLELPYLAFACLLIGLLTAKQTHTRVLVCVALFIISILVLVVSWSADIYGHGRMLDLI